MDLPTAVSAYNVAVEGFREQEYPMLKDSVYLDHAGSTLCAKSLMDAFAHEMASTLYGNPHSGSWSSQLCTTRIDDIRLRLLRFFNADPSEYDVVFVPNATAGVKLVVEAMRALPEGYSYVYHQACHTSLVGAREDARRSTCVDDFDMDSWLRGKDPFTSAGPPSSATLFSFSAQSHMDGRRFPLSWPRELKEKSNDRTTPLLSLLDAASFTATSQLDLSSPCFAPDFVVVSLYKIFGFPDLGALIVRRSAECIFDQRRYFGGGTVDVVTCKKEQWHARKTRFLHERLEDGTLPFHNIIALDSAMTIHTRLFGSMDQVRAHTSSLALQLFDTLESLRHGNASPVCVMYSERPDTSDSLGTGPVVSFNLRNSAGGWVSLGEVEKLAILHKIHIRTGGLCSPGNVAATLGLEPWEMRRNLSAGIRCGADSEIIRGKPTGVIRASVGAMSTKSDITRFLEFVKEFFVEDHPTSASPQERCKTSLPVPPSIRVKSITVFPIKSCGGYVVPPGVQWDVKPEGLAWDREWCLVHPGSGQALSQKRYPKMTLFQPSLDFEKGLLRVTYHGSGADSAPQEVQIPLSADPSLFGDESKGTSYQVCGDEISAQAYFSPEINNFFSQSLGAPCVLARFPAGGRGPTSRTVKARIQKHQHARLLCAVPGSFPDVPSPPDSDAEHPAQGKMLLANESPIMLVNSSSVDALNGDIVKRGGSKVRENSFRANIVIEEDQESKHTAYSEDTWRKIRIGNQEFKLLGACRRCQMVCVDQTCGIRRQEPFSTLAKTRRFDGKVYFGAHMKHEPRPGDGSLANQAPTIQVGEAVTVDAWIS
ncbi:molybdenum cofactor sulfurase [Metarhizium album ARSEF 1941]|uniref:Molybdenum cofactor sulfurase n=1 Tax=Metarhizium album (strain ARSEF 1941) TaxID=1081103 RepID=A0A0B2WH40_METAS|nr:molybdenum cofactor sulfurase [Metarhizium album ARSEF 1941]KHN95306.1 molybdenum cofactor sulfurase [Metarhizium album ARSEF 1941]